MKKIVIVLCVVLLVGCGSDYAKPTSGTTIVAFGDSLTAGYGIPSDDAYPAQLSRALGEKVINLGVSGDTTSDARDRIDEVLEQDPRVVIVLLGGNDVLQQISPKETFTHLDEIIRIITNTGASVVLVGVRGGLHNTEYKNRFKEIAQQYNIPYVEDALKGIFGKRELMYDTVHPNGDGYAVLAERIEPLVREQIESDL